MLMCWLQRPTLYFQGRYNERNETLYLRSFEDLFLNFLHLFFIHIRDLDIYILFPLYSLHILYIYIYIYIYINIYIYIYIYKLKNSHVSSTVTFIYLLYLSLLQKKKYISIEIQHYFFSPNQKYCFCNSFSLYYLFFILPLCMLHLYTLSLQFLNNTMY